MTVEDDRETAASLVLTGERLLFADFVAVLDAQLERTEVPPSWLVEAALAKTHADALHILRQASGDSPELNTRVARARAAQVAADVIAGSVSPILGARELLSLQDRLGVSNDDSDFRLLAGIDSETDALPFGAVRNRWQPAALIKRDQEIGKAEEWALRVGGEAFRAIARRWGKAG